MKKRMHVYFSGRVQGVGFRFTAREIASRLGVFGWVKNLFDGGVEITAEADENVLNTFLETIKNEFSGYIDSAEINWSEPTGEFKDFRIRF